MNKYKDFIKIISGNLICAFWKVIGVFIPKKKNLIVFDSFVGKQYSCNPRAIYEYMLEHSNENLEFVWAFTNPKKFLFLEKNRNTRVVKYHSFRHQYLFYCAGTIVFNWKKTYDLPARKGQTIIQTWHGGGCYKTAGTQIKSNVGFHAKAMKKATNIVTDYISSSDYFSKNVIINQQQYEGNIIETGMPRNDCLINQDERKISEIKEKLGIDKECFIVMYAPTYRDSTIDQNFQQLDYTRTASAIENRFGKKVVFLYRGHHYTKFNNINENVKNVSDYFDMQDLLLISDMLISDYSSSIWDYSFTYRPCLLYTPDLEKYIEGRGLDEDIYSWGFPVALSNDELEDRILEFNENEFKKNMIKHHEKLGSFENGNATESVYNLILSKIKENTL